MADKKIFCSADEYAWCEKCLKSARRALEFAQKAKPGTAAYESAPKQQAQITLLEEALATFDVRPGSVRSTTGAFTMSVEFQEAFASLPQNEVHCDCGGRRQAQCCICCS